MRIGAQRDRERTIAAAIRRLAHLVALGLLEIGQQRFVSPTRIAGAFPAIETELVAANEGHRVDRARSAVRLAARKRDAAVLQPRLGLRGIAPVEFRSDQRRPLARRRDRGIVVRRAARFEQQHAHGRIRRQTIGQHAAGRSGADDDEVEFARAWVLESWGLAPGLRDSHGCRAHRLEKVTSLHKVARETIQDASIRVSRPSSTSISNSPGLTIRPVSARRVP